MYQKQFCLLVKFQKKLQKKNLLQKNLTHDFDDEDEFKDEFESLDDIDFDHY